LDGADVHEGVGLAVVALDEAEALHGVEELDRAACLVADELAHWATPAAGTATTARGHAAAPGHPQGLAINHQLGRGDLAAAIDQRELERLAFCQARKTGLLDRADVHEHILAAVIAHDEAEALLAVEEFDDTGAFANDLGRHAAASAAAATTEAATAAAEA